MKKVACTELGVTIYEHACQPYVLRLDGPDGDHAGFSECQRSVQSLETADRQVRVEKLLEHLGRCDERDPST